MSALGPSAGALGPAPTLPLPPGLGAPLLGAPGGAGGGMPGAADNQSAEAALKQAAKALQAALNAEQDPEDKALIAKLLQGVHGLEAGRQKEQDAAMGLSAQHKFIRRQVQSASSGPGANGQQGQGY